MKIIEKIKSIFTKTELDLTSFLKSKKTQTIIEKGIETAAKLYKDNEGEAKLEAVVTVVLVSFGIASPAATIVSSIAVPIVEKEVQFVYNTMKAKGLI